MVHPVSRSILVAVLAAVSCVSCHASPAASASAGHPGSGPSFDCSRAATRIDKSICASTMLSTLDRKLAEAYASAKRQGGERVRERQLRWLKQRNTCTQATGSSISSCLEKAYRTRLAELAGGRLITRDTSSLTQSQWFSVLSVGGQCSRPSPEKDARLVHQLKLDDHASLLVLACRLGAYQDSHLVFRLTRQTGGTVAKPLIWLVPVHHNGWRLRRKTTLVGDITLSNDKQTIKVYYRSAGSGACGHVARYSIADLEKGSAIRPVSAKGHDDCLNGMYPNAWPELKFQ